MVTKFKRVKLTLLILGKKKTGAVSPFFLLPLLFPAPLPIPMKYKQQTKGIRTPHPTTKKASYIGSIGSLNICPLVRILVSTTRRFLC